MGKHRHKKSFYDVDEDELHSSHTHHHHHHHHRRRHHAYDKQDETKQRVPSISSFNNSKIDDDEAALQSPPTKRQRSSSSNSSQSPSKILSQLIENPEFLANAGPKAKEFAETARQLLAKPDLDPTTQQIICAMAQAAVNVGKRLNSSSSTPADQCVDDISVTNSTIYSSSTLLSPTLSNTSSSSTSNTPQQQLQSIVLSNEENKTTIEPESDEDILIKQMIERAMKLTQQGDTRHAQHLLGIIHEKLSNKRKRAAAAAAATANSSNCNDNEKFKISSSNDFHSLPSLLNEDSQSNNNNNNNNKISPTESEQSNDYQNTCYFSYPPPPPLPPPPPPPPLPDINSITSPRVSVPPIEQVQELLSNPSEVQDILKKLFGTNENQKITPPEEYQIQSHLTSPSSLFHSQPSILFNNNLMYSSSRLNNNIQSLRVPSTTTTDSQPYNSSLAFMQGNRRNLPPLQITERCFSSSNNKNKQQQPNRSFSFSSSSNAHNGIMPLLTNTTPPPLASAPPLMKVNPKFSLTSSTPTPLESISSRWSNNNEQQRGFHPFWCATCALGFPHQVAYQDHLRSHIPCNVPGCSYAASEQLVRIHHLNIHENNLRNRMSNNILHQTRPMFHQQQSLEPPWPLMRM
ncbi:unnamed protein product [Rotaria sordida]|uniref:C2H2-type domain-containing protein n=1 Tax=Rotaria sordida TaxID=392033 RepID=A0A818ZS50_9BILA|nr:unnamed protein product [Rotaria sordida]